MIIARVASIEARVNWVELVRVERVRNLIGSFGSYDLDIFKTDHLVRWDDIARPVPVWRTQRARRLQPTSCIRLVALGNLDCFILERLLKGRISM